MTRRSTNTQWCSLCDTQVYAVYSLEITVYSLEFTVYSLEITVYSLEITVYSLEITVYSLEITVYSLEITVYSLEKSPISVYPLLIMITHIGSFTKLLTTHRYTLHYALISVCIYL